MDELDAYLDDLIAHTAVYFFVDDLTYLHRGGRISGVSKVMGNLLGIKPILYFNEEGKLLNIDKKTGRKLAQTALINYMKVKGSELDKYEVFVMQADCQEEAEKFAENIKLQFNVEVRICPVGPVIGSHCGPGTLGVIFHSKEK